MITFLLFFITLTIYSIFSYSLVDPNLVLSSIDIYWNFQQWMWSTFFNNGHLMAYLYFGIVSALFILYFHILTKLKQKTIRPKKIFNKYFVLFIIVVFPLFFSYNALSHDIFNYIFNAKMVVIYKADPTKSVALDYSSDLWTRFMHNTDTPAPYGRGWIYLSLIPYQFGFSKLTLSLASFRVWNLISIFLLYLSFQNLSLVLFKRKMSLYELSLVFFNPLFLIEIISNYHNDLWMMALAVFAVSFAIKSLSNGLTNNQRIKWFLFSIVLLLLSFSIKLASIALLPIWLIILIPAIFYFQLSKKIVNKFRIKLPTQFLQTMIFSLFNKFMVYIPDLAAFLMFLPLLTDRSKQFLPWYILWVLVWIPFMKIRILKNLVIVFTLSSSLRYLPWLINNLEFSNKVIANQKLITWILPLIFLLFNLRKKSYDKKN